MADIPRDKLLALIKFARKNPKVVKDYKDAREKNIEVNTKKPTTTALKFLGVNPETFFTPFRTDLPQSEEERQKVILEANMTGKRYEGTTPKEQTAIKFIQNITKPFRKEDIKLLEEPQEGAKEKELQSITGQRSDILKQESGFTQLYKNPEVKNVDEINKLRTLEEYPYLRQDFIKSEIFGLDAPEIDWSKNLMEQNTTSGNRFWTGKDDFDLVGLAKVTGGGVMKGIVNTVGTLFKGAENLSNQVKPISIQALRVNPVFAIMDAAGLNASEKWLNFFQDGYSEIGQGLQDWSETINKDEKGFLNDLSIGIGSSIPFYATGYLSSLAGLSPMLTSSIAGLLINGQSAFEQTYKETKDINKSLISYWVNGLVGLSEGLPVADFVKRFNTVTSGSVVKSLWKNVVRQGIFEEGPQEFSQQITQETTDKILWNKEKTLGEALTNSIYAGFLGAITGGLMGGAGTISQGTKLSHLKYIENNYNTTKDETEKLIIEHNLQAFGIPYKLTGKGLQFNYDDLLNVQIPGKEELTKGIETTKNIINEVIKIPDKIKNGVKPEIVKPEEIKPVKEKIVKEEKPVIKKEPKPEIAEKVKKEEKQPEDKDFLKGVFKELTGKEYTEPIIKATEIKSAKINSDIKLDENGEAKVTIGNKNLPQEKITKAVEEIKSKLPEGFEIKPSGIQNNIYNIAKVEKLEKPSEIKGEENIEITKEYKDFDADVFNEVEDENLSGLVVKENGKEIGVVRFEPDLNEKGIGYILGLETSDKGKGYGTKIINKLFTDNPTQKVFEGKATKSSRKFWEKMGAKFEDDNHFVIDRNDFTKTPPKPTEIKPSEPAKEKVITKPIKVKASEEFKVGDVLDPQGNSNAKGKVTITEITGNTIKYKDSEGTHYSGMQRSLLRNLIKEGSWKKASQTEVKEEIKETGRELSYPISKIATDTKRFQNRDEEYSQATVDKIVNAVKEGKFNLGKFAAIKLWTDPKDNKTYVLAGHSRLQAFKQLNSEGIKGFDKVPAIKLDLKTENEAVQYAKDESNRLHTGETIIDSAKRLRELREQGKETKELETLLGGNKTIATQLSYLNPKGQAISTLKGIKATESESSVKATTVAEYIGRARQLFPEITNSHEQEMFEYLMNEKNFKNVKNKSSFLDYVETKVSTLDFDKTKPLNLKNLADLTPAEVETNNRITELQNEKRGYKKELDELAVKYKENGILPEEYKNQKSYSNLQAKIKLVEKDIAQIYKNRKSDYGELGMFGQEEEIVKPKPKENEEQPRDTEIIESEIESIESESENAESDKQKGKIAEKCDEIIDEIESKLKLLGYYDSSGDTEKDMRENGSRTPERKFKKDLSRYSKELAKVLGWEHDTNRKGKVEYANTNIAPIGGDGHIILWKPNSEYGVYISVPVTTNDEYDSIGDYGNEGLKIEDHVGSWMKDTPILWRITTRKDKYTGKSNNFIKADVTVGEFKKKILKSVEFYEDKPGTIAEQNEEVKKRKEQLEKELKEEQTPYTVTDEDYKDIDDYVNSTPHHNRTESIALEDLHNNLQDKIDAYIEKNPNLINTDEAREFIKGYNGTNAPDIHEAASLLAKIVYRKMLVERSEKAIAGGKRPLYVLMTGSPGNGKTTAIDIVSPGMREKADLIHDGIFDSEKKLKDVIANVMKHNYRLELYHVYANPLKALNNALDRIKRSGRTIYLPHFKETYDNFGRGLISKILEEHGHEENIDIKVVENVAVDNLKDIKEVSLDYLNIFDYTYDEKELNSLIKEKQLTDEQENQLYGGARARSEGQSEGNLKDDYRGYEESQRAWYSGYDAKRSELLSRNKEKQEVEKAPPPQKPKVETAQGNKPPPKISKVSKNLEVIKKLQSINRDEIDSLLGDLNEELSKEKITTAGLEVSDKAFIIGTKLVGAYLNQGIYKVEEILLDTYIKYKENFAKLFDAIKSVYAGRIISAAKDIKDKMTKFDTLDNITIDDIIKLAGEDIQAEAEALPINDLANAILTKLKSGESIKDNPALIKLSDEAFQGTIAQGKYTIQDSYDALETGINMYIEAYPEMYSNTTYPLVTLKNIRELLERIPTQSGRTQEKDQFQQFSTPPTIGFTMHYLANVNENDTELDPSAGNGGLLVFGKNTAKQVVANEIYDRRRKLLEFQGYETTNFDGKYINDLMTGSIKPTVIDMNPPFSATGGKSKNDTMNGLKHIEQALSLMENNGRAVILFGEGLAFDKISKTDWWEKMMKRYNVRANITVNAEYAKYGTTFGNQLIVIDKTGKTPGETYSEQLQNVVKGEMPLEDILTNLKNIRDDRPNISESQGGLSGAIGGTKPSSRPGSNKPSGTGVQPGNKKPAGSNKPDIEKPAGKNKEQPAKPKEISDSGVNEPSKQGTGDFADIQGVDNSAEALARQSDTSGKFTQYIASKIKIGKPHPASIVESTSMAAIEMPDITYHPKIQKEVIESGLLSNVQLEAITYAGQRHSQILQDGNRAGFFFGDGTGVGKGKEIAGVILDNYNNGTKKILWLSFSQGLESSSARDLKDVGLKEELPLMNLSNYKIDELLESEKGVLFSTYSTFISQSKTSQQTRLEQVKQWLGNDCLIIFDECHKGKNFVNEIGKPTKTAETMVNVQNDVPNAKIIYSSATGATEVRNMAYMTRLGLWGDGTSFYNFENFQAEIESGGLGAMEIVSRDMKALGMYVSRRISYEGVQYAEVKHNFTPEQKRIYDTTADLWQEIMKNIDDALGEVNGGARARGTALQQFWSTHQRFYNQLITAFKIPTVIKETEKYLSEGKSVVLSLINTNEIATEVKVAVANAEGTDLAELDFTPREMIAQYLDSSFPVNQYEDQTDPQTGKTIKVLVVGPDGKALVNQEALAMKNALMDRISDINIPQNPLDQLVNHFGTDNIAELSGRKKRLIINKETGETKWMDRRVKGVSSNKINNYENEQFQKGTKRVAVITAAASTGISLHSSKRAVNQDQRVMITVQMSWSADSTMQTFGRVHRSNQVTAPIYVLLSTDASGEVRFSSTMARRLSSLGALSTGQRNTTGGDNLAKYDISNDYGKAALASLYDLMLKGHIFEGLNEPSATLRRMGVLKMNQQGGEEIAKADLTHVERFLNRILALRLDEQNATFKAFEDIMRGIVETAKEQGTYDEGIADINGENIEILDRQLVNEEDVTKAKTYYFRVKSDEKVRKLLTETIKNYAEQQETKNEDNGFYRNEVHNKTYYIDSVGHITDPKTGALINKYARYHPSGKKDYLLADKIFDDKVEKKFKDKSELSKYLIDNLSKEEEWKLRYISRGDFEYYSYGIDGEQWRVSGNKLVRPIKEGEKAPYKFNRLDIEKGTEAWENEVSKIPATVEEIYHVISGAITPIWNQFKTGDAGMKTVRFTTKDGERVAGIEIPETSLERVLANLGVEYQKPKVSQNELYSDILGNGNEHKLIKGMVLKRVSLHGDKVIEIANVPSELFGYINNIPGIMNERIQFKQRYFIPAEKETADKIFEKLLKDYPIEKEAKEKLSGLDKLLNVGIQINLDKVKDVLSNVESNNQKNVIASNVINELAEAGFVNYSSGIYEVNTTLSEIKEEIRDNSELYPYTYNALFVTDDVPRYSLFHASGYDVTKSPEGKLSTNYVYGGIGFNFNGWGLNFTDAKYKAEDYANMFEEAKARKERNLYKISVIGDENWLDLDLKPKESIIEQIKFQLKQEGQKEIDLSGKGQDIYEDLTALFKSEKEASLFLDRAGITGNRVPIEMEDKGLPREKVDGMNYVVFNEDRINIDEHVKYSKEAVANNFGIEVSKISNEDIKEIKKLDKAFRGNGDLRFIKGLLQSEAAFGKYYKKVIALADVQPKGKAIETYIEEVGHQGFSMLLTDSEKQKLIDLKRSLYDIPQYELDIYKNIPAYEGLTDEQLKNILAEEEIMQDFKKYYKTTKGFKGTIKLIFDKVIARIKQLIKNLPLLKDLGIKFGLKENYYNEQAESLFRDIMRGNLKEATGENRLAPAYLYAGEKATGFNEALKNNKVFQGKYDEKQRYEIDDSQMKVNDLKSLQRKEYDGRSYIVDKLGNLIEHKKLFEDYPDAKDMQIVLYNFERDDLTSAEYRSASKHFNIPENITVWGVDYNGEFTKRSTLIHEIQHAIQEREGFAKGGNADAVSKSQIPINPDWMKYHTPENQKAVEEYNKLAYSPEYKKELEESNALWMAKFDKRIDDLREQQTRENFEQIKPKIDKVFEDYYSIYREKFPTIARTDELAKNYIVREPSKHISKYDVYKNMAGEIEARDVQSRLNLSAEERINLKPYSSESIPKEKAIIHYSDIVQSLMKAEDVKSPNFKKWFGKSKVVDENGEALRVAHGTPVMEEYTVFDTRGIGSHFGTEGQARAKLDLDYKGKGRVDYYYLSLQNPIRLKDAGDLWSQPKYMINQIAKFLGSKTYENELDTDEIYNKVSKDWDRMYGKVEGTIKKKSSFDNISALAHGETTKKLLQSYGYDGIVYANQFEDVFFPEQDPTGEWFPKEEVTSGDSYIAFNPEQIKSADKNIGTYDPNNPDIRYMSATAYGQRQVRALIKELATKSRYGTGEISRNTGMNAKTVKKLFEMLGDSGFGELKKNVLIPNEKFKQLLQAKLQQGKSVDIEKPFLNWLANQTNVELKKVKSVGKTGKGEYGAAFTSHNERKHTITYAPYTPETSFAKEIGRVIANEIGDDVNNYTEEYKALGFTDKDNFNNFASAVKELSINPDKKELAPEISDVIDEYNVPSQKMGTKLQGKLTEIPGDKKPGNIKATKEERKRMYKQYPELSTGKYTDGINWNLNNFSMEKEVNDTIKKITFDRKELSDQKRGVRNWETTEDSALLIGLTDKELTATKPGDIENADYLYGAKLLLNDQAQRIVKLRKSFGSVLSKDERQLIAEETLKLSAMRSHFMALGSEVGRALNILRNKAQAREFDILTNDIVDMCEKEKIFEGDTEKLEDIKKMVKKMHKVAKMLTNKMYSSLYNDFMKLQSKAEKDKPIDKIKKGFEVFSKGIVNMIDQRFLVQSKFGENAPAEVIEKAHLHEAKNRELLNKFLEDFSDTYEKLEDKLNKNPEQISLYDNEIKEIEKYLLDYAETNGLTNHDYRIDFIKSVFKDARGINTFLQVWKEKNPDTAPTIKDAEGYGLKLKSANPFTNLRKEFIEMNKSIGLMDLVKTYNYDIDKFVVQQGKADKVMVEEGWVTINHPAFKGLLFNPDYARLVRNLIESNKVSASPILRAMRVGTYTLQSIKFFGSVFHGLNMLTDCVSQRYGGIFNLRGYKDIWDSAKSMDEVRKSPEYLDELNSGFGDRYSLEEKTNQVLWNGLQKLSDIKYLGKIFKYLPFVGTSEYNKYIPASPAMINFMFDSFIPHLKYIKNEIDFNALAEKTGRTRWDLTAFEKQEIIRRNQYYTGEMNERLFGRSGTVTSALRFIFNAPSYSEGNFRAKIKAIGGDKKTISFIFNSLLLKVTAATIGTLLLTGIIPDWDDKKKEIRDFFKIKTGQKDGDGNNIYIDLLTYEKDYWILFGNVPMATIDILAGRTAEGMERLYQIPGEFQRRLAGMVSSLSRIAVDLFTLMQGGMLYNYKGDPEWYQTDPLPTKFLKFLGREVGTSQPISSSTLAQGLQKGDNPIPAIMKAIIGIRTTNTEQIKREKQKIGDAFSMIKQKDETRISLNKLYHENPDEAKKKLEEFNNRQLEKARDLFKGKNISEEDLQTTFTIKSLKEIDKPATGTDIVNIFKKKQETPAGQILKKEIDRETREYNTEADPKKKKVLNDKINEYQAMLNHLNTGQLSLDEIKIKLYKDFDWKAELKSRKSAITRALNEFEDVEIVKDIKSLQEFQNDPYVPEEYRQSITDYIGNIEDFRDDHLEKLETKYDNEEITKEEYEKKILFLNTVIMNLK